ncbi:hypothetical protein BP5796_09705 [Coleophoma crateriformis]|uniref:ShKT domain-containing protein n=1 Tax=Coleophoma crateriformis TaxID=565419 RepID=A0A3D8QYT0_9HELO|nr:hypothetical protein BP5796_09705 [Coleophoma crateriformis]
MEYTHFILLLSTLAGSAYSADCYQPRKAGDPSSSDIATALTGNNQLLEVCSGNFPPINDTSNTFNHWYMDYTVTRADPTQSLQYCIDAFNDIISQCITGDNYWGGDWSLNGFSYSIYNSIYGQTPDNPLGPDDAGGPGTASTTTTGSIAGETIVTQTDEQGSTVIATFIPATVAQYSKLQVTTTVTTTTTSSGTPVVFPWVIGPGGIAFIPIPGEILPPGIYPPDIAPNTESSSGDDNGISTTTQPSTTTTSTSSSTSIAACTNLSFGPSANLRNEGLQVPLWILSYPSGSIPPTTTTTDRTAITPTYPPAQTVTNLAACQVCVLPYGSTDPYCNTIPNCQVSTPTTSSTTSTATTSSSYPGCTESTSGYTCQDNCRNYVACQPWCVANCAYCFNTNTVR